MTPKAGHSQRRPGRYHKPIIGQETLEGTNNRTSQIATAAEVFQSKNLEAISQ